MQAIAAVATIDLMLPSLTAMAHRCANMKGHSDTYWTISLHIHELQRQFDRMVEHPHVLLQTSRVAQEYVAAVEHLCEFLTYYENKNAVIRFFKQKKYHARLESEMQAIDALFEEVQTFLQQPRKVWVVLADADGRERSSPAAVTLLIKADIHDLRVAVKEQYADSLLRGIAPSDLRVFEHAAAFGAGQGAMAVDATVGARGTTAQASLVIVATPDSTDTPWWQSSSERIGDDG